MYKSYFLELGTTCTVMVTLNVSDFLRLVVLSLLISNSVSVSYLDEIKEVVSTLKQYFHSGLEGLAKLAETIETVEQFVDATIDEDCEPFTCPPGQYRVSDPNFIPYSNGCGSFGLQQQWKEEKLPHRELEQCCHNHDLCYDECGTDKDICDLQFKKCLYKVCSNNKEELSPLFLKACKGTAKLMYTGTLALGCKAFQDAQNQACTCVGKREEL